MFCIKVCFLGAGAGRSRAFKGGAGAEIFYIKPEPKKKIWSRSRKKKSGAGAEKNASAPQHCLVDIKKPLQCFGFFFVDLFGKVTKL